jgi:hypothetical protein
MPLSLPASFRTTVSAWAVAAAMGLLFAIGLATAPIAMADTCANAAVRVETNSSALPDCRGYEMVSSPYKEGFVATPSVFSDDGIFAYGSAGSFAGNTQGTLLGMTYLASRSSVGWTTTAPGPPEAIFNSDLTGLAGWSADLRRSLWMMSRRDAPEETFGFWLRDPDGGFTRIGDADSAVAPRPSLRLKSADLSHIVFNYATSGDGARTALREYVGTGNGGPPRLVSANNFGESTPSDTCPNGMSADGRVIVWTSGCFGGDVPAVWARIGGAVTVAVSGSECTRTSVDPGGACNSLSPAEYAGAADDGSRVFFTTSQQLVNGDTDTTNDLYACDLPAGVPAPVGSANACASLTQVSGTATNARVENVIAVSDDGSRVYFVAQGVLAGNLGVGDVGADPGSIFVPEPHNLYVWERDGAHPAGQTRFVARLASNDLSQQRHPAQMTPDGRYLLFTTGNAVVTAGPGADTTDGAIDVYRYDADSGVMLRVSTSVTGDGGNDPAFTASIGRLSSMTSNGSTVVFETAEALSRDDTNGVTDVYSWRDGQVSLISRGGGSAVGITPSGRDMFFATKAPVLAVDGDVIDDVYDARVGGGVSLPRIPPPCFGDGCQGLLSGAPGLAGPRSGLSGDSDPDNVAATLSLRAVTAGQRRRLAATGKLALAVKANAAGRVSATARAKIRGRSVTVGSGRHTMTTPGSVAVTLKLSRRARGQLAARGRLTVKVVVSHSKATRGRSVTLKLTRARAKSSSVGGRS